MVTVIKNDYTSKYYEFALDNESELAILPTTQHAGKSYLATISRCCNGSYAYIANADYPEYTLNGETDQWTLFTKGGGGGGGQTGGLVPVVVDSIPTPETAEPNKLYLIDSNHDGTYEGYVLVTIGGVSQVVPMGSIPDLSDYYDKEEVDELVETEKEIEMLTQAEYDALPEKDPNKLYFITDGNGAIGIG